MIGLAIFAAVAIAAAFKKPRGPMYWVFCVSAVAYLFVIGPLLFGGDGLVAPWIWRTANEPLMAAWEFLSVFAIYGGAIGLPLLAIRDGRGTIQAPRPEAPD